MQIRDVLNLRQCSNLQKVDFNNNPMALMDQYRHFVVFYLSQISMLDSRTISQNELSDSRERFERNEIDKVLQLLEGKEGEIKRLKSDLQNLANYKRESEGQIGELQQCIEHQKESIHSLSTQLATQREMIRSKNEVISRTRNELSEMEERYQHLQGAMADLERQHSTTFDGDQKEESETLEIGGRSPKSPHSPFGHESSGFQHRMPPQLTEACSVYLESIQSVSEMLSRYDALRQQHEATKENMAVITQQISKSNAMLNKLRKRNDIRSSMDHPFEHDESARILSETPRVAVEEWSVSPILAQKKRMRQHPDSEHKEQPQNVPVTISEDGIKAKIDEAHRIEEEIRCIEQQLQSKRQQQRSAQEMAEMDSTAVDNKRRKSSLSSGGGTHDNNGSMGTFSSEMEESRATQQELVHQLATLVQSMDAIEPGFSMQQKLSHSQDFDDLRIKLMTLYIRRFHNERDAHKETAGEPLHHTFHHLFSFTVTIGIGCVLPPRMLTKCPELRILIDWNVAV